MPRSSPDHSDFARIELVKNLLLQFLHNNKVEWHELKRAEAMIMREQDERRKQEALERRSH